MAEDLSQQMEKAATLNADYAKNTVATYRSQAALGRGQVISQNGQSFSDSTLVEEIKKLVDSLEKMGMDKNQYSEEQLVKMAMSSISGKMRDGTMSAYEEAAKVQKDLTQQSKETVDMLRALVEYEKNTNGSVTEQTEKELAQAIAELNKNEQIQKDRDKAKTLAHKDTTLSLDDAFSQIFGKFGPSQQRLQDAKEALNLAQASGDRSSIAEKQKEVNREESKLALMKQMLNALSNLSREIYTNLQSLSKYRGQVLTRLDGAGANWESTMEFATKTLATSTIASSKQFIETYVKYADQGYAFNLEQRALIESMKDTVAKTFDAFNANLIRLERIQNGDQTVARLGEEVAITKLLNSTYGDSAYMNNLYDTVSGNLLEAEATMTKQQSAEFDYVVQKWLGSLYSSGVGENTISSISGALGKLGSGNVSGLNGTQEQVLLALSANRAGLDYADLLTNGLTADKTNSLLAAMVGYLQEIASSTSENNVLTSAFGDVLKLSVSDIKALGNSDYSSIASILPDYGALTGTAISQIGSAGSRLGLNGQRQNLIDNFKYTMATTMAQSEFISSIYQILYDSSGLLDVAIPTISAMGFGLSFEGTKVSDIMKAGLGGLGILSGLVGVAENLTSGNVGNNGIMKLMEQEYELSTTGAGFTPEAEGGVSQSKKSTYNLGEEELTKGSMQTAKKDAEDTQGTKVKTVEKTTDDIYKLMDTEITGLQKKLFEEHREVYVHLVNTNDLAGKIKTKFFKDQETFVEDVVNNGGIAKNTADIYNKLNDSIKVEGNFWPGVS